MSIVLSQWKWAYYDPNHTWRKIGAVISGALGKRIHHIICGGYVNSTATTFASSEMPAQLEFYSGPPYDLVQLFLISARVNYTFDSTGKIVIHSVEIHGDFPPAPQIKIYLYGPVDFVAGATDTTFYVF